MGSRADSSSDPGDPILEAELRSLDRTLRALPEPSMRRERLLERLEAAGPDGAFALISATMHRSGMPAPHLYRLREILQELLREGGATGPLDDGFCEEIFEMATAAGDEFVARLFERKQALAAMHDPSSALPRAVAEIPLGIRRALAKGVDVDLLERLLRDPDPIVIENLLENPRVTEDIVVRISARRPIAAKTLDCIQRSRRFGQQRRVQIAIARNPYCPTRLAIQLLGVLPQGAVRDIAEDGTVHELTRRHARDELSRRESS